MQNEPLRIEFRVLKQQGRAALKGRWFDYMFTMLIAGLIAGVVNIPGYVMSAVSFPFMWVLSLVLSLAVVPLTAGLNLFFIRSVRANRPDKTDALFETYKKPYQVWEQIKAHIVVYVFIALGFICLIIPGIVLALKYSFVFYIMADEPEITYREAMQKSAKMTDGRKSQILGFVLSFFFWWCFGIITFGLGFLYVAPYQKYCGTAYYCAVREALEPSDYDSLGDSTYNSSNF